MYYFFSGGQWTQHQSPVVSLVFLSFEASANRTFLTYRWRLVTTAAPSWNPEPVGDNMTCSYLLLLPCRRCLKCICVAPLSRICVFVYYVYVQEHRVVSFSIFTDEYVNWVKLVKRVVTVLPHSVFFSPSFHCIVVKTRWSCCSLAISILPEVPVFIILLQCKTSVSGLKTNNKNRTYSSV